MLPEKVSYLDLSHASILPTYCWKLKQIRQNKSVFSLTFKTKCWITPLLLQIHLAKDENLGFAISENFCSFQIRGFVLIMTHCVTHDKSVTILVRRQQGRGNWPQKATNQVYSFICLLYILEWERHALWEPLKENLIRSICIPSWAF